MVDKEGCIGLCKGRIGLSGRGLSLGLLQSWRVKWKTLTAK